MSFGSSAVRGGTEATAGDGSRELPGQLRWDGVGLEEVLRLEAKSGNDDDDGGRSIGDDKGTRSSSPSVSSLASVDDAPAHRTTGDAPITGMVAARATTRWKLEEAGSGGKRFSAGAWDCCRHAA